jgi:dGTPase
MNKGMYEQRDWDRVVSLAPSLQLEPYRSEARRDSARLLHSPVFRRLQGKLQLFPSVESDFFRNRLTHSLEVGQIAKSIAIRLNETAPFLEPENLKIDSDLVELAGWAHDLGHPPFGHTGEEALDNCMHSEGGFEGNAQTLRILAKLEKKVHTGNLENVVGFEDQKDCRVGLNLTFRTLASILKYDKKIPIKRSQNKALVKGYYSDRVISF